MDYLVRFSQFHESFRLAELKALAVVEGIDLRILEYSDDHPFCIIAVPSADAARALIRRAILIQSIHELWGYAPSGLYEDIHADVRARTEPLWSSYATCSFKFIVDAFQHTRTMDERVQLINSFSYLAFQGRIDMRAPDETTTSMDSELALVTANMALAAPGKIFYDPFVGTGSFPVAAAHFGALAFGSDIDGRSFRGQGGQKSLKGNFAQYGLEQLVGEFFTADLTNTPLVRRRWMDGIVCDPPYGVREGLKVLGCRDPEKTPNVIVAGEKYWNSPSYIAPKKPYSFLAMLDDILEFATQMLVDEGRLSFWMPTANDEDQELNVPTHPCLEIVSVCVQPFNRWSRRLITYRRMPDSQVDQEKLSLHKRAKHEGVTADELNPFRERYFKGFKKEEA
ncbi:Dual specificity protein kinase pom1 [Verticillium dahliae VDG1]|nr:Dual specificity protein kinase pom1 [Verticillium dahliae VDG1]